MGGGDGSGTRGAGFCKLGEIGEGEVGKDDGRHGVNSGVLGIGSGGQVGDGATGGNGDPITIIG